MLRLIESTEIGLDIEFVAAARLCEAGCSALGLNDWFPYEYKMEKSSRVGRPAAPLRKFNDSYEEWIPGMD